MAPPLPGVAAPPGPRRPGVYRELPARTRVPKKLRFLSPQAFLADSKCLSWLVSKPSRLSPTVGNERNQGRSLWSLLRRARRLDVLPTPGNARALLASARTRLRRARSPCSARVLVGASSSHMPQEGAQMHTYPSPSVHHYVMPVVTMSRHSVAVWPEPSISPLRVSLESWTLLLPQTP